MTATIAAVIPTRNRAALAINAVRSLLDQDVAIEIFLSDNSSSGDELRAFCRSEPRVHYLRPEREMPAAEHWDWAVRQAMQRSDATHFTIHYDRKYSKPRHWGTMAAIAAQWPDRLVTYGIDSVADQPPLRLCQMPWTGKVFRIEAAHVARLLAGGRVSDAGHALPLLSNCVVPRTVLQSIVDRFGDVCRSTGPDSAFAVRFLALHDDFLHYDCALSVAYAMHRSSGLGFLRGGGGDFADWMKTFGDGPWLDAAPIPGVNLGQNMLFHEYELVRREVGERLPPIDRSGYLNELGAALRWVRDPRTRAALRGLLEEHGWRGEIARLPRRRLRDVLRDNAVMFLVRHFRFVPSHLSGVAFSDDETALHYALKYPQRRTEDMRHLAPLDPVEVRLQ